MQIVLTFLDDALEIIKVILDKGINFATALTLLIIGIRIYKKWKKQKGTNELGEIRSMVLYLYQKEGGSWPVDSKSYSKSTTKPLSNYSPRSLARIVGSIMKKMAIPVWGSLLRRINKMKWLKPDKIAISMGVIIAAANEYFGWALDTENVAAFFFMLFVFFKQHEIVTITRHAHGLPSQIKVNSTKLVYTLIGLALTAADTFYSIGLGPETVLLIAASISGYNAYEGKADLVKTEPEAKIAEVERLRAEMEAAAASEPKHPLDAH